MVDRNEAQIFTLEGLGAAVLIIFALYFLLQSPTVSTSPTSQYLNVQLAQSGRDALVALDMDLPAEDYGIYSNYTLKDYLKAINKSDLKIAAQMRKDLISILPKNVMFNVVLCYVNLSGINVTEMNYNALNVTTVVLNSDNKTEFMTNLMPPKDSATASHLVVIYDDELDQSSPFKINATQIGSQPEKVPHVIEVRLELWYV